jgi:hypothetical protein
MLYEIKEQIELCFMCARMDAADGGILKDSLNYKTSAILISAYNKIAKIYYKEEFIKESSYKNVAIEYKVYCEKENEK